MVLMLVLLCPLPPLPLLLRDTNPRFGNSFLSLLREGDKDKGMEEHDAADDDTPSFRKGVRLVAVVAELVVMEDPVMDSPPPPPPDEEAVLTK
mmetsp:Transcript_33257/g.61264  ORF Transcript_33257/g.61264 Transcript_33257/m.61264 type:complete len:93 (-) Transcript_33257:1010-1288(-)